MSNISRSYKKRMIFEKPGRVFLHAEVQVLFTHSLAMLQQRLRSITCKDVAHRGLENIADWQIIHKQIIQIVKINFVRK